MAAIRRVVDGSHPPWSLRPHCCKRDLGRGLSSASHRLAADSTSVSRTLGKSKVERLMTLSTLAVAVCCCNDSRSSLSNRVFSMAITAWLASTSEVLQVISSSAGELLPVFAAILKNAVQICGAEYGQMFLFEEGSFRAVATHDLPRAWADLLARSPPIPADPKLPLGRLAATKRVVEVADLRTEQGYIDRYPTLVELVEVGGARTLLIVPMLKENALVGAIGIHRQEVRPL